MSQALRVALWVPTTTAPDVGDGVITTAAETPSHALPTRFAIPGTGPPGIGDALADGKTYGRKNNAWVDLAGGGGITEAPNDGQPYVRQSAAWLSSAVTDAGTF
jgi:hypothetical protein